jgi:hypothetical protein
MEVAEGHDFTEKVVYEPTTHVLPCVASLATPVSFEIRQEFVDLDWLGTRAMVLYNVMTPGECKAYIDYMEGTGALVPAGLTPDYRNNDRVVAKSEEVAAHLFGRIAKFLPFELEVNKENQDTMLFKGLNGLWQQVGMNETFRLCKYNPGGHFGPHWDGDFARSRYERSLYTFMIYLNDGYEGGNTTFAESHDIYRDPETNLFCSPPEAVRARIVPTAGMALVFQHKILHEGQRLIGGTKYIMRSDVMYRQVRDDCADSDMRKGLDLLEQAERAEATGNYDDAVTYYRKAYRLCPELERVNK